MTDKKVNIDKLKEWRPKTSPKMLPGIYYSWYPGLPNMEHARFDRQRFAQHWRNRVIELAEEGEVTVSHVETWYTKAARRSILWSIYYVNGEPRLAVAKRKGILRELNGKAGLESFCDGFYKVI